MHERMRTHTHTHTHTYTILTRNSFPNSSQLLAWIILIFPLPFSELWLTNLLVPLRLTYDTFYISQSHTIPTHFYPKNTERMFFQNTDVQLQGCLNFFVLLICSNPFWVIFTLAFKAPFLLSINPTFRNQLNVQQGPQTLHSQALWSSDTSSWMHIRS